MSKGLFTRNKPADASKGATLPVRKDVRKRWMYVVGGLVVFAVASSTLFSGKKELPVVTKRIGENFIDVTPKGAGEKSWQAKSQKDILELKEQNRTLQDRMTQLMDESQKQASLPTGTVAPPTAGSGFADPLPVIAPPKPKFVQPDIPAMPAMPTGGAPVPPSLGSIPAPSAAAASQTGQFLFEPPVVATPTSDAPAAKSKASDSGTSARYTKNKYSGFLPAGAFARAVLLNGVEAGTSATTQSNPQPVLIAINDYAVLPGAARYNIKSCFGLGSGYGDASSERVYLRLAQLSCVDKADRLVLTTPISGYVVDSDGKVGLRGTVIDRQGARLSKSLLAGFAQGLSGALGAAQSSTSTSAALGTVSTLSGGDALKASGLSGAQSATQQLAQFYLKEAQNLFPVISIDTGRTATIVFTEGVGLIWGQGDSLYVEDVKPANSK